MNANERIFRSSVLHQVLLARLSNRTVRQILNLITEADIDIVARIQARLGALSEVDLQRLANGKGGETTRLARLLEYIRSIDKEGRELLENGLADELEGLAEFEAEFQANAITKAAPVAVQVSVPSVTQLEAAVRSRPFQGRLMREWASEWGTARRRRVMAAVRLGVLEGDGERAMARRINEVLDVSKRSARMIARTAHTHVTNSAREQFAKRNEDIVGSEIWTSTLDGRTSGICRSRSGNIYKIGVGPRPPAHPNCLPPDTLVTSSHRITGASKHLFDGNLVVISTASGKKLSCTPNHPILTDHGWISANSLNVGGNVVCDGSVDWKPDIVSVNHKNVPTSIEKVAEAFFRSRGVTTVPVPTTAEDFHGDGMDGDIAIVSTNRFLERPLETTGLEQGGEFKLLGRCMALQSFAGRCGLASVFFGLISSSNGIVRRLSKRASLLWTSSVHSGLLLLGPISKWNLSPIQDGLNRFRRYPEVLGNSARSYAAQEHLFDGGFVKAGKGLRLSDGHACLMKRAANDAIADAKLARDICDGSTGEVFLDEIVHIGERYFSGHVYNLETEKSYYIAEGIVNHNCRSFMSPVLKTWRQLGYSADELTDAQKEALSGDPDVGENYDEWFAKLPREAQEDIIGPTKLKLFEDGGLDHDDLVVASTGRELSLDELRVKHPEAFRKAFPDSPVGQARPSQRTPSRPAPEAQPITRRTSTVSQIEPEIVETAIPEVQAQAQEIDFSRLRADGPSAASATTHVRRNPFTASESLSLREYKAEDYARVNRVARSISVDDARAAAAASRPGFGLSSVDARVGFIDRAISKSKLSDDVVLYRGVEDPAFFGLTEDDIGVKFEVGTFQSTSLSQNVGLKFAATLSNKNPVLLKVNAKKGLTALDMDRFAEKSKSGKVSFTSQEREILLPRNLSYKVKSVSNIVGTGGRTVRVVEVDIE